MNILHARKYNKKWETTYEGKNVFIQTEYSLHYKVHRKKRKKKKKHKIYLHPMVVYATRVVYIDLQ